MFDRAFTVEIVAKFDKGDSIRMEFVANFLDFSLLCARKPLSLRSSFIHWEASHPLNLPRTVFGSANKHRVPQLGFGSDRGS